MSEQIDTPEEKIYYDQRSVALRTTQSIYFVQEHDKISMLGLLLNDYKEKQIVIVVKSKKKIDELNAFLILKDFNAISVHGNHRQEQQQKAITEFNLGTINIIITTDMIFKKIALENIKLVVSYDLPDDPQDYYNRLAFMKEMGEAFALINQEDERFLGYIEANMKQEIQEKTLEGFVASETPIQIEKTKKDKKKKPRHNKMKIKKEKLKKKN